MAPDLKRKVDENRRARLALEEGMKQQQNAQVGSSFSAVSHHTSPFVLCSSTRSPQNPSGQTRQSSDPTRLCVGREKCATAVSTFGAPPPLGSYGSSQSICAKRCRNGQLIVQ